MAGVDPTAARRLALLIDADNISSKLLPSLLARAAEFGTLVIRRAYGNSNTWSKSAATTFVKQHAITPVLVVPATTGKDAADMKLAIEAVDLLHRGRLDGMCIASSDGDFTPLVVHLRDNGLLVYGFGESKTPPPYQAAFDQFLILGRETPARAEGAVAPAKRPPPRSRAKPASPAAERAAKAPVPAEEIVGMVEEMAGENGWVNLGPVGSRLNKREGKFDPRRYGYRNLRDLLDAIKDLETDEANSASGHSVVRVRKRIAAPPR